MNVRLLDCVRVLIDENRGRKTSQQNLGSLKLAKAIIELLIYSISLCFYTNKERFPTRPGMHTAILHFASINMATGGGVIVDYKYT